MFCNICQANLTVAGLNELITAQTENGAATTSSTSSTKTCYFCLGLLHDDPLMDQIGEQVAEQFNSQQYDGDCFLLALNMPITQLLRESIAEKLAGGKWAPASMSPKELFSRCLMAKLGKKTGLRPSLNSNLTLTISLETDEFRGSDFDFLLEQYPGQFEGGKAGRKRRRGGKALANGICNGQNSQQNPNPPVEVEKLLTKEKVRALVCGRMSEEVARKYKLLAPTKPCTFTVAFERDPVFVAGRYCKYSRNLPQSQWGPDDDGAGGESVGEKISAPLVHHFGATSSRFTASGREDIDVRMLGTGRPFVVQLLNARRIGGLRDGKTLSELTRRINESTGGSVMLNGPLVQVDAKQAQMLNVGQEEKRKTYSALCYSKVPLSDANLNQLAQLCPVELWQKTVVRVLKRRPLLDRCRNIYWMQAFRLDDFHFQLRLETQAGTYVKEFVHGDFGRTRPSLAELMGLHLGQVDILQLDVLAVDLEWPPPTK